MAQATKGRSSTTCQNKNQYFFIPTVFISSDDWTKPRLSRSRCPPPFNANLTPINTPGRAFRSWTTAISLPLKGNRHRWSLCRAFPLRRFSNDDDGEMQLDRAAETNKLVKLRVKREKRVRENKRGAIRDTYMCIFLRARARMCVCVCVCVCVRARARVRMFIVYACVNAF